MRDRHTIISIITSDKLPIALGVWLRQRKRGSGTNHLLTTVRSKSQKERQHPPNSQLARACVCVSGGGVHNHQHSAKPTSISAPLSGTAPVGRVTFSGSRANTASMKRRIQQSVVLLVGCSQRSKHSAPLVRTSKLAQAKQSDPRRRVEQ
jgi:hypothetical protein